MRLELRKGHSEAVPDSSTQRVDTGDKETCLQGERKKEHRKPHLQVKQRAKETEKTQKKGKIMSMLSWKTRDESLGNR